MVSFADSMERSIIGLDLYPGGMAIGSYLPGVAARPWLGLHLPEQEESPRLRARGARSKGTGCGLSDGRIFQAGEPTELLADALEALSRPGSGIFLDETVIVLGVHSDPFVPFEGKFDSALRCLELLAGIAPYRLCVQTRSPLIVLALPILKSLGSRMRITIAFEAATDQTHARSFPDLPRPSERLKTVRVLTNFGISTAVQLPESDQYGLKKLVGELVDAGALLYFCDNETMSSLQNKEAGKRVAAQVAERRPELLLGCIEEAWLQEFGREASAAVA